ncbi:hypothetical protein AXI71_gp06 [Lactococcus phage GE1]|uniref:Uncharacterized protein n=1 Tax=Lactococcus phage GE1 TaxID=1698369 RepID=A0A0N7E0M5_9CAUD|nr:hypothetical protein AXI71_gp06 [Lactococcus phage GE1]ALA06960.1 hypothetical protein [Lactococcus phage GE1]
MELWYIYNETLKCPANAKYLPNKLAMYTDIKSAKRGLIYIRTYNPSGYDYSLKEIEL